jgi:protein-tyrosine-phosphatase
MIKVLVLCHGNVNRSPLCEAVLKQYRKQELYVISAALKEWKRPERATKKMRDAARKRHDIELRDHRSQPIDEQMIDEADYIVYMDQGNRKRLERFPGAVRKAIPLGRYSELPDRGKSGQLPEPRIKDPAFVSKDSEEFIHIVDEVVQASHALAQDLIARHSA